MNFSLEDFSMEKNRHLVSLFGIQRYSRMKSLVLDDCVVSSLQPLSSLSSLERLQVSGCGISSLEGLSGMLSTSLRSLQVDSCSNLTNVSGIEQLKALESLKVFACGVTGLQPLCQLGGGIGYLSVSDCSEVQEVVLELPQVQPTAHVEISGSGVREVVLAGGVIRAMEYGNLLAVVHMV
jgi:hypothetical protein